MFTNECLGELSYESVTAAVFLAGVFVSFVIDYLGARFVARRQERQAKSDEEVRSTPVSAETKESRQTPNSSSILVKGDDHSSVVHMHGHADEKVGVMVLEAGMIFHSLRKRCPFHMFLKMH
jgi:zinc transporter 1/2/3